VDDDGDAARLALRAHLFDYYLHLPYYHGVLERDGFEAAADALRGRAVRGDTKRGVGELLGDPAVRAALQELPDAWLDARTVAGTPAECRRRLGELVSEGIDVPVVYPFPSRGDWEAGCAAAIEALAPGR
jgi:alkanesulfonate monooxygenase SsuD/methylene tetrahydromethanopterin reductase-like flavin-dependent oxidoreductase (luciferase family)